MAAPPPPPPQHHVVDMPAPANAGGGHPARRGWARLLEENDRFLEDVAPSLMVVAALVAGFALQAGLNPPGGVVTEANFKGKSMLAVTNRLAYERYFTIQTIALIASISVVACMVSGLPLNRRAFVLVLRLVTWISLMAMALVHAISVSAFTPLNIHGPDSVILTLRNALYTLSGVMGAILCAHIVRLVTRRGGRERAQGA